MLQSQSKEEILDKVEQTAYKSEMELHGCGRCCLAALMEHLELGDKVSADACLKAILPLSGGIAHTRNTCAALLGGLMAIGIAAVPGNLDDVNYQRIHELMELGRQYYRDFEKEVGNVRCFDIRQVGLGRCYDTADPEEQEKFAREGGYEWCSKVCGKAARLAARYIFDIWENQGGG